MLDEVLSLLPYFACLRPDERVRVAAQMRRLSLEAAQSYALNETSPELVVVARGAVGVERGGEGVRLFTGDSLGEAEVLAGHGPKEFLTASTASVLAILDRAGVDALLAEFPIVARPGVAELGRGLTWRNDL